MFITNNDIKIICKLEKDDGNTVKIKPSSQGTGEDHTKVKVTTPASNISISDIFNFSPGYFDVDQQWHKFQFHADHSSIHDTRLIESYQFSGTQDYLYASKGAQGLLKLSVWDIRNNRDVALPSGKNEMICDPRNILTKDGSLIDVEEYDYQNTSKFLKFSPSWSKEVKSDNNTFTYVVRIDHVDRNDSTQDKLIGELPVVYPYFDTATSQIKFIGGGNVSDAAIKHAGADSGYFTIESKNGNRYGYFSDENGKPTSQSEYNKFPLSCTALDLIQLAQIEELAQKNLELEECHSAALSTAQVKGKAISTVVNRVKRQVEEDEIFKGDIKDLLKGDKNFKDSVRGEPGPVGPTGSQGVQGERGIQGFTGISGATAEQVGEFLLTQKGNDLGKAVIDADSSNQHPLSSWLKDKLKDDQDFQENVADELLDRTNGNSIVSEVAKRINKRSVEDRAVKKVTDKVDVQDIVDKVDPDKVVEEVIEAIGSSAAERIVHDKIQSVNKNRFADKLVQEVGSDKAKDIVRDKINDPSLLIDKLLEKSPSAEQKIIAILTDPSNTELIIKAFADKYPEIDIESIIKNLQKPRAASDFRDFNVRNSLKQGEEAAQQAEIAQKSAENARDEAKGFANQAKSSAEEATSAKNASINSLHEIAQRYSNLSRDKSNLLRKAHKVKRSTVEENVSEETTQILTMHDIRRLLEKNVSESANRVKRNAKNMVDSSEEKTVKEMEKINLQVTQMESEVSEVKDMFTQVDEKQQEIQERMQEIAQDVHQVESDSLNAQRTSRKVVQRADGSRIKAKQAAEESVDARDESQIFAENSSNSASEAQVSAERAVDARDESQVFAENSSNSASEAQKSAERAVDARDKSQIFAENSSNSASEAQVSVEKAAQAIEKIEEEIKDMEQRIPHTTPYSSTYKEKKDQIKIIQSDDNSTEIAIEGKGVIGKFSKAGYYFRSGQLHIHNPETGVDIVVPSEFNLLKVVENSEMPTHYMLVLTNQLGNELFEYKKYDPTFSSLANEFKSLDLQQIKTLNKINFQSGSYFILKPGAVSSQGYAVNVHEIESNEKIGTLVDEFCYYQNGKFNYMNYHTGSEIHHPSSHEHYLSLSHSENYQAESSIVCEESSEKVAHDVNPIITGEFSLLEYLADHSPI